MRYLILLLLSGCATAGAVTYLKPGATESEMETARRECEYDVAKATQNNRYFFSMGDAIASGIVEGMEKAKLRKLCLESKGFVATQETSPATTQAAKPE